MSRSLSGCPAHAPDIWLLPFPFTEGCLFYAGCPGVRQISGPSCLAGCPGPIPDVRPLTARKTDMIL